MFLNDKIQVQSAFADTFLIINEINRAINFRLNTSVNGTIIYRCLSSVSRRGWLAKANLRLYPYYLIWIMPAQGKETSRAFGKSEGFFNVNIHFGGTCQSRSRSNLLIGSLINTSFQPSSRPQTFKKSFI